MNKIINNSKKIITAAFASVFLALFSLVPYTCVHQGNWTTISYDEVPGVVSIVHNDKERYIYYHKCTGVLIAEDLVVTAGHCIRGEEMIGNDPIEFITIGYNCNRVTKSRCDEQDGIIYLHQDSYLDIALFFLKEPIDYPIIPVAKRSPKEGQDIWQAGYGLWSELCGGHDKVWVVAGLYFTTSYGPGMRPEKGDSGGPTYILEDSKLKVVGITVASHTGTMVTDKDDKYQYVTYVNLAIQRDWIANSYKAITGKELPE